MDPRPRTGRPWFHVGQRVCCVDATPNPLYPTTINTIEKLLVAGKFYIIRAIDLGTIDGPIGWGVHLRGILTFYPDESRAPWAFNPLRFRAIVERKPTDISLFNAILEGRYALPLPEDEEEEGTWL